MDAINRLYSPNVESVEPIGTDEMPAVMNGIDAIRQKNQWWIDNNVVHSAEAHGPFTGEDQFAVHYVFDTTFKPTGERKRMEEMALYTVKDGQVAREQFFSKTCQAPKRPPFQWGQSRLMCGRINRL
jgi:hypothetical protein